MDSIHSYEQQKSSADLVAGAAPLARGAQEANFERLEKRVIIVDRHEPTSAWSATSFPAKSIRTDLCYWLFSCLSGESSAELESPLEGVNRSTVGGRAAEEEKRPKTSSLSGAPTLRSYDYGPFKSNELLTSKYTILNFLPKNLFEQFRRLANFYFLTTALLQIFLPFSPVGPTTSLLPLLFVIMTTAIKQAYEDYLRHRLDREVNGRVCQVLRNNRLERVRSKDIKVGDFVYVKNNEEIPCDMILLATSAGDRCYVTTANLDGETNLKPRSCVHIRDKLGDVDQLDDQLLVIECDKPNATLYEFNGFLRAPRDFEAYKELVANLEPATRSSRLVEDARRRLSLSSSISSRTTVIRTIVRRIKQSRLNFVAGNNARSGLTNTKAHIEQHSRSILSNLSEQHHEIPLDISNLLLRASRLRNTSSVYGLAIYTGSDTKLAKNSHVKPNKFSSTESKINLYLCVAFSILMLFSFLSTLFYRKTRAHTNSTSAILLRTEEVFVAHFLLYNYLIPISLYVTLEFIKFFGTVSVVEDRKMRTAVWVNERSLTVESSKGSLESAQQPAQLEGRAASPPNDLAALSSKQASNSTNAIASLPSSHKVRLLEKPKCNSSDLNEELGQVEVLFTDKTGTLTENEMCFTACSAYGSLYRFVSNQLYLEANERRRNERLPDLTRKLSRIKSNRYAHLQYSTKQSEQALSFVGKLPRLGQAIKLTTARTSGPDRPPSATAKTPQSAPFNHRKLPPLNQMRLVDDLDKQERVAEFFICVCLCSTITLNENQELADCLPGMSRGADYDFQTASPDEESLIRAAHSCGVTMCKSNERECYIVIERSQATLTQRVLAQSGPPQSPGSEQTPPAGPSELDSANSKLLAAGRQPSANEENANELDSNFKAILETKNSTEKFIVRHFQRLLLFEFNSVRKRMSVIYRDCDNNCLLMVSKGSEDLLDCVKLDDELELSDRHCVNITLAHFEAFAKSGLRTLLVARKVLRSSEYERILNEMKLARSMIQAREKMLNKLYTTFERDLKLIGASAVEDTLQEGVPETIENLKLAGVKVWLLTGDKVETAISVAYLSRLLDEETNLFYLVRVQDSNLCQKLMRSFSRQLDMIERKQTKEFYRERRLKRSPIVGSKFALITDGRSLYYAMKYQPKEFARLCKACQVVLGCRLSPLQKAEVVDMIKQDDERQITAAIGDGANDVSMIQEAHVGIGVHGKEGRQAINSSDFGISRFHLLNRLFFVHGHRFYHRTATTILYFFYKNILFVTPQFIYSFYNSSPALSLYHPILLICFNLFFTSAPILLYGLHEKHLSEYMLEQYPSLYRINRKNYLMRMSLFSNWLWLGFIQGLLGFYIIYYCFPNARPTAQQVFRVSSNRTSMMNTDLQSTRPNNPLGIKIYFLVVLTATARLYFVTKRPNLKFNLSTTCSVLLLPLLLYAFSLVNWHSLIADNSLHGQIEIYLKQPMFWVAVISSTCAAVLPDLIWYIRCRMLENKTIRLMVNAAKSMNTRAGDRNEINPIKESF